MRIRTTAPAVAPALALVCGLAVAVASGSAVAQSAQPQAGQGQAGQQGNPPPSVMRVSDEKLEAFTRAAITVQGQSRQWQSSIQSAGSEAEAEQMKQQAQQEMAATVQQQPNITVKEYVQISQAMRQDAQLYQRVQGIARRLQEQ